jgi:hypothetical protein
LSACIHHETRNHALPGQVEDRRSVRGPDSIGIADLDDRAVADDDGLAFLRGCSGAVNVAHVAQGDDRSVDLDEAANGLAELRALSDQQRRAHQQDDRERRSRTVHWGWIV